MEVAQKANDMIGREILNGTPQTGPAIIPLGTGSGDGPNCPTGMAIPAIPPRTPSPVQPKGLPIPTQKPIDNQKKKKKTKKPSDDD
jgi:hypothetical protein